MLKANRKNKLIVYGAALVIVLACGSIGRVFSLQHQLSSQSPQAMDVERNARLVLTLEEQTHRLALVTHLRDTWKPWAEKHRGELQRMLSASPTDTATRDAVWSEIPSFPRENIAFIEALNPHGDGAKGEVFSWFAISKGANASQMSQKDLDHQLAETQSALEKDFASHRDFVISDSSQIGKTSVSLWASGRVTEDTSQDKVALYKGFGVFVNDHKEILPPYDFLSPK